MDKCKPGDRVALSGIHRALPSKGSTTGMFATIVLGNNLRHFSKELTQGAFHEEDIANIKRLGKRPSSNPHPHPHPNQTLTQTLPLTPTPKP